MSALPFREHRFTVEDVLRMSAAGVFEEGPRLELVEGRLVEMTPQGDAHYTLTGRLANRLRDRAWPDRTVAEEKPIRLDGDSLPEPDVQLLRRHRDRDVGLPTPDEVLLVAEVSVTSQAADRHKATLYARAGIPVCWTVDVPRREVVVWSDPQDGAYRRMETVGVDGRLTVPEGLGEIAVRELFEV